MKKVKNKAYVIIGLIITICIILSGCSGKGDDAYRGEQSQLAVERIFDKIKTAYGDDYLPDSEIDTEHLKEEFKLDKDLIEDQKGELPAIGFHPDRLLVVKAKKDKGKEVETQLKEARQSKIDDSMMYPVNAPKINAAKVVRRGDYVAFILLGANNEDVDAPEKEQAEFAVAQTQRGVDAFEEMFR